MKRTLGCESASIKSPRRGRRTSPLKLNRDVPIHLPSISVHGTPLRGWWTLGDPIPRACARGYVPSPLTGLHGRMGGVFSDVGCRFERHACMQAVVERANQDPWFKEPGPPVLWHARPPAVAPFQGFNVVVFRSPGRCPGLPCRCPLGASYGRSRTAVNANLPSRGSLFGGRQKGA